MAQITFNVGDAKYDACVDAWCAQRGYSDTIYDEQGNPSPNPETKIQFVRKTLKAIFLQAYILQQAEAARKAAEQQASGEV